MSNEPVFLVKCKSNAFLRSCRKEICMCGQAKKTKKKPQLMADSCCSVCLFPTPLRRTVRFHPLGNEDEVRLICIWPFREAIHALTGYGTYYSYKTLKRQNSVPYAIVNIFIKHVFSGKKCWKNLFIYLLVFNV